MECVLAKRKLLEIFNKNIVNFHTLNKLKQLTIMQTVGITSIVEYIYYDKLRDYREKEKHFNS